MSLRQVANTTRISVMSLEALERSDLSRLPGGIFTRSFVRAYAEEVGLDPDRTMQDFIAELPPEAATATARPQAFDAGDKIDSDQKAAATVLRLILVSLPIVGLVVYYGTRDAPPAPVDPPAAVSEAPAASVDAAASPGAGPGAMPQASRLIMEMAPRSPCWVSVTVDGEPTFSKLMAAGEKRTIAAREQILVSVRDAGAFAYTLNGREGRPLGAPGEAASKRITLSNLDEFTSP